MTSDPVGAMVVSVSDKCSRHVIFGFNSCFRLQRDTNGTRPELRFIHLYYLFNQGCAHECLEVEQSVTNRREEHKQTCESEASTATSVHVTET